MLLDGGEYATFKQIQEAGGKVKKGGKSQMVVFWKWIEVEDENTEEVKQIPLLVYYRVGSQVEGLERKRKGPYYHDPIGEAERVKEHLP